MKKILAQIRKELLSNSEEKFKEGEYHYFKEKIRPYGVRSGKIMEIAKKTNMQYALSLKDVLDLGELLEKDGWFEEQLLAGYLAYMHQADFQQSTFFTFEKWVSKYVDNWANCDNLCNHSVAACIEKYPTLLSNLKKWTSSENRWVRRAAAVTLILPARHGKFLKDVLEIAEKNISDKDEMVQKGTGWLLREAAKLHEREVFEFLMKHKDAGRTLLRYATERFPLKLRKNVLE
jgi:3-methyladenine DNA glycosylase AlkD